jgi:hypothetical protein
VVLTHRNELSSSGLLPHIDRDVQRRKFEGIDDIHQRLGQVARPQARSIVQNLALRQPGERMNDTFKDIEKLEAARPILYSSA